MAFVPVCKDLSKVKTKVALNLTKRQLLCFSVAGAIGIPAYLFTRGAIGNSAAVLVMIGLMLPLFFLAMYEKDGQPAEIVLRNFIRVKLWPGKRPYVTANLYQYLEEEAKNIAKQDEAADAAGTPSAKKYRAGRQKQSGRAGRRKKQAVCTSHSQ
ncbi:MAG: PrgI family protein [Defluviitaleaceae bacterium]|nr:PrgI family protein [Defluviitaleaceae bacterium]